MFPQKIKISVRWYLQQTKIVLSFLYLCGNAAHQSNVRWSCRFKSNTTFPILLNFSQLKLSMVLISTILLSYNYLSYLIVTYLIYTLIIPHYACHPKTTASWWWEEA